MEITSLIVGLIIGGAIASIILYLLIKTKNVSKESLTNYLKSTTKQLQILDYLKIKRKYFKKQMILFQVN